MCWVMRSATILFFDVFTGKFHLNNRVGMIFFFNSQISSYEIFSFLNN